MNIYKEYMDVIREAVASDSSNYLNKGLEGIPLKRTKEQFNSIYTRASQMEISENLKNLGPNIGTSISYDQELGLHPDFKYLKGSNNTEEHYIVSTFIDIKGSTNLFKKFDKETIFLVTNAIQRAAIHTALVFGGYIHRLQGDGLFIYFGSKSKSKSEAVLQALQAVSVYTHFVKHDLKEFFASQGIDNISVRSGVDLGYSSDVLWGNAGIGEISEVTTCSLHTSLASKMQSSAQTNGVVVGENIKSNIIDFDDMFKPVSQRTGNENDRYIYRIDNRNFTYTQYDFNWSQFLKKQPFIALDQFGNMIPKTNTSISNPLLVSSLKPIAEVSKPYFTNGK